MGTRLLHHIYTSQPIGELRTNAYADLQATVAFFFTEKNAFFVFVIFLFLIYSNKAYIK